MAISASSGDQGETRRRCAPAVRVNMVGQAWRPGMPRNSVNYDEDFYGWTVEQSRLLRSSELSAIDAANIAEEIESMGRSDRPELKSRLVVLLMHVLKWRHQPGGRSRSWSATIDEQRLQIEGLLVESPSLQPSVPAMLAEAHAM